MIVYESYNFSRLLSIQKRLINKNIYVFKMEAVLSYLPPINVIRELYSGFNFFIIIQGNVFYIFFHPSVKDKLKYVFNHALTYNIEKVDVKYIFKFFDEFGIKNNIDIININNVNIVFDKRVFSIYDHNKP